MTTVEFPLKPGKPDVKFKFTVPSTRRMELSAGAGIDMIRLRGQSVVAICLMTCYALQWQDRAMTEDKAADLVEAYLEDGGDMKALSDALVKALTSSGVYGTPEQNLDGDADPTTAKTQETTTV